MTIKSLPDGGKIITLSKEFDSRAKVLNAIYFFVFTATYFPIVLSQLAGWWIEVLPSLIMLGLSAAYLFAGYKFLNKASQSEKLIVNKETFTIQLSGIFSRKKHTYQNAYISGMAHVEKPAITRHPLTGDSIDYLGFQTSQAVINEMHGDKRVSFMYEGRKVTFGENVYSWELDELIVLLYDTTGYDFRYIEEPEKEPYAETY